MLRFLPGPNKLIRSWSERAKRSLSDLSVRGLPLGKSSGSSGGGFKARWPTEAERGRELILLFGLNSSSSVSLASEEDKALKIMETLFGKVAFF